MSTVSKNYKRKSVLDVFEHTVKKEVAWSQVQRSRRPWECTFPPYPSVLVACDLNISLLYLHSWQKLQPVESHVGRVVFKLWKQNIA